jgi:hypothetical protein
VPSLRTCQLRERVWNLPHGSIQVIEGSISKTLQCIRRTSALDLIMPLSIGEVADWNWGTTLHSRTCAHSETKQLGFPVMEVGIETRKINKNERKEKNSRNSHLGDEQEFPLPSHLACITHSYMLIWMGLFFSCGTVFSFRSNPKWQITLRIADNICGLSISYRKKIANEIR